MPRSPAVAAGTSPAHIMFITHTDHDQTITVHVPFGTQRIVQSDTTGETALKPLGGTLPKGSFPAGYQLPDGRTVRIVADAPDRTCPPPAPGDWLMDRYAPQVIGALRAWATFLPPNVTATQRLLALLADILELADPTGWPAVIERTNRTLFTSAEPLDTQQLRLQAQTAGLLNTPEQAKFQGQVDTALALLRDGHRDALIIELGRLTPSAKGSLFAEVADDTELRRQLTTALQMLNEMREADAHG